MAPPRNNTSFPTAEQVARVLIASCREAKFPLEQLIPCLSAWQQKGGSWHFGRVRAAAALALRQMFPEVPALAICRMVGTKKKDFVDIDVLRTRSKLTGVDPEALQRIVAVGLYQLPTASRNAWARPAGPAPAIPTSEPPSGRAPEPEPCVTAPSHSQPEPPAVFVDIPPSKQALREELRRAIERTAKMKCST